MNYSLINKAIAITLLLTSASALAVEQNVDTDESIKKQTPKKEQVDMGDPTAIYSSFGMEYNSEGTFDISGGVASGNHLLFVETKNGFDALSATYANMAGGSGFYAETTFNKDARSLSGGYVITFKPSEIITFYPVAMIGYTNHENIDYITPTGTLGVYTRINIAPDWHLGVDPFVTVYGREDKDGVFSTLSTDMFVGYQFKQHRVRLGYASSLVDTGEDDHSVFMNYKIAF